MTPTHPILSIIVPIRNEERFVERCVKSILADAPLGGLEVIVVDGMSDDRTADIVKAMALSDSRIILIRNPSRFVPQAMNISWRSVCGKCAVSVRVPPVPVPKENARRQGAGGRKKGDRVRYLRGPRVRPGFTNSLPLAWRHSTA